MDKIKASFIMEIMGRPPEHIKEALQTVVVKMGSENGVSIADKKYHEPKEVQDVKNLFTTFAEVDAEFDSIEAFFSILMSYMPSNIEIYEPEKFKLNSFELNSLGNFILSKLHKYDEIAKQALFERDIVISKLEHIRNGGKIEDVLPKTEGVKKEAEEEVKERKEETKSNVEKEVKEEKQKKKKDKKVEEKMQNKEIA